MIAGVDEVGRGAWAGPVVAGAVVLPDDMASPDWSCVKDSKKLSAAAREKSHDFIIENCVAWAIGFATADEIDQTNIREATLLAMLRAVQALTVHVHEVLVDGRDTIPHLDLPCQAIVQGDGLIPAISAASIVAKVTRDRWMTELHQADGRYAFDQHKGYGTVLHQACLQASGPSSAHRQSFKPIRAWSKK
jgi:ribonuclease HII